MPFHPDMEAFVQEAVRLPHDRLRRIDRSWSRVAAERRIISGVIQDNNELRVQMSHLREYLTVAARMAGATGEADSGPRSLLAEEVAEAIFPAARAVLLRDTLEQSSVPAQAEAYAVVTAPFSDILPKR